MALPRGRKRGGQQEAGWQFTVRQLYENSGSTARFSDFALDVRKIVEANSLPEYHLTLHRNEAGDFLRKRPSKRADSRWSKRAVL